MKPNCKKCRYGQWEWVDYGADGLYHCLRFNDWISEEDGENEDIYCDGFEPDDNHRNDDTTKRP